MIECVCRGSAREMGIAQGTAVRAKIEGARRDLSRLDAFRSRQPWWLPYRAYRWLAERKAARYLDEALVEEFAPTRERLAGIAAGAGTNLAALGLFNSLEPLLSSVGGCTACPGACSAVAVRGARSATGETIVARNFDYLPLVQPFYVIRESRPAVGLASLDFTVAPLAGAVDGVNEAGLCITYDYAFTIDRPTQPAPTLSMVIAECLARCASVAEAAEWIATARRWGGGLLMLADATGDIASMEISSTRSFLRRPAPGEDLLFHTNAFVSDSMRAVQVPWNAVFTDQAPTALRGRRLHRSSELRDRRFVELLDRTERFGLDDLQAVMADHGPEGQPTETTLCVHGSYWYTTASLQLIAESRRMRAAFDTACRARYWEGGVKSEVGSQKDEG